MPRGNFNQRGVLGAYGPGYRRCPRCGTVAPATPEYFYVRPGNGRAELCLDCRGQYFREYSAARRSRSLVGNDRKFGVEIEFIGSGERVAAAMTAAGLPCEFEGYNHQVRATWKVVPDSSVYNGAELVSPPLHGENGREQIRKACRALRDAGATVNNSCGLHVHHEVRNLSGAQFRNLYRLWFRQQSSIDQFVSRSRRNGEWSHHLTEQDVANVDAICDMGLADYSRRFEQIITRYKSLNVQSFPKYGTVEVRLHQGTTSATKILAWIALGQAFITWASDTTDTAPARDAGPAVLLEYLQSAGGMRATTAEFLHARVAVLSNVGARGDADDHAAAEDEGCEDDEWADDDERCDCPSCIEGRW